MNNQNPSVVVRKRNIQTVLDYCLENRIECKMSPKDVKDEWEMVFSVADIMKAINLGMFLRENKLNLIGLLDSASIKNSSAPSAVKAKKRKSKKPVVEENKEVDNATENAENGMFDTTSVDTKNIFNSSPSSATIEDNGNVDDEELPL